jgi:hypothetical protein
MKMSLMFVNMFMLVVLCCHLQTKQLILYLCRQQGGWGMRGNRYGEIFFDFLTVNSSYFPTQRLPIRHIFGDEMCLLKEGN